MLRSPRPAPLHLLLGLFSGFGGTLLPTPAFAADESPAAATSPVRLFADPLPIDLRSLPFILLIACAAFAALFLARRFARHEKPRHRHLSAAGGLLLLLALLPAVIVSSPGMAHTVHAGDTVLADPLSLPLDLLERGDLLVITPPGVTEPLVRRLIGLPSDTVEIRDEVVFLNGSPLDESYVQHDTQLLDTTDYPAITLGANEYYVLADERKGEGDSRSFGPISPDAISGRAVALLRTDPSAGAVINGPRLLLLLLLLTLLGGVVLLRRRLHLHLRPVLLIGAAVVALQIVHPYYLVGRSMDREVADGDTAITESMSPRLGLLTRGDIVAVNSAGRIDDPQLAGIDVLIKRVIGLPGETLRFKKDHIYINGVALDEPYLSARYQPACGCHRYEPFTITLGPDHYFVLGDNRDKSLDSRSFGSVPLDDIEARVIALFRSGPFE